MEIADNEEILVYDNVTGAKASCEAVSSDPAGMTVSYKRERGPAFVRETTVVAALLRPSGLFSRAFKVDGVEQDDGRVQLRLRAVNADWTRIQRREYFRTSVRLAVTASTSRGAFDTWTSNLCGGGALSLDPERMAFEGEEISLRMDCGEGFLVSASGTVVREQGMGPSRCVAVMFTSISEIDRDRIVKTVFKAEISNNKSSSGESVTGVLRIMGSEPAKR